MVHSVTKGTFRSLLHCHSLSDCTKRTWGVIYSSRYHFHWKQIWNVKCREISFENGVPRGTVPRRITTHSQIFYFKSLAAYLIPQKKEKRYHTTTGIPDLVDLIDSGHGNECNWKLLLPSNAIFIFSEIYFCYQNQQGK